MDVMEEYCGQIELNIALTIVNMSESSKEIVNYTNQLCCVSSNDWKSRFACFAEFILLFYLFLFIYLFTVDSRYLEFEGTL